MSERFKVVRICKALYKCSALSFSGWSYGKNDQRFAVRAIYEDCVYRMSLQYYIFHIFYLCDSNVTIWFCPCVCLIHAGIVHRRIKIGLHGLHCEVAQTL